MAQVITVAQVLSLAQGLPHAMDAAKKKRKKNEIEPFAATGMDLEIIILNQTGKGKYHSYVESKIRCK